MKSILFGFLIIHLAIISPATPLIPDSIVNVDFCKLNKLCTAPRDSHIACQLPRPNLGSNCPPNSDVTLIDINSTLVDFIVDKHNYYRDQIASGNVTGYPKASRMLSLHWEDILAYFSESNTRQCVMRHDTCRRTPNYNFVGQNICKTYSVTLSPPEKVIDNCIDLWFLESNDVPNPGALIDNCCANPKPAPLYIGHFTQMVTDRNQATGCAMITYKQFGLNYYLFTCDYSNGNVIGIPTYRRLKNVPECTKFHPIYTSLCDVNEPNDPNKLSK